MNQLKLLYIFIFLNSLYISAVADKAIQAPSALYSNDTQNPSHIQQIENNDTKTNFFEQNRDLIIKFIKQPQFTKPSIKCFFRHTYNNPYYADKYLPFDLSHILTFSSFAPQTTKPREYLLNVLSVFKQKIFFSRFINGYEFEQFIKNYISLISPYFDQTSEKKDRVNKIKETIYALLYDDFEKLKAHPEKVLDETANNLDTIIINSFSQDDVDASIYDFQNAVFSFLELCLSKLIWSPTEHTKLWQSIKSVSIILEESLQKHILKNTHQLNELFWSQIASFNYLLEHWGNILPESFYTSIIDEINNKPLALWSNKENDPLLLSKFRQLNYMLNQGKMRSKLHENRSNLKPVTNLDN